MRISLINVNLVAHDAIGQCILNQWRFFTQRGDDVTIFTQHAPTDIDEDVKADVRIVTVANLVSGNNEKFNASDLYVYHYPSRYALMDTLPGIDRGSVILYYHNVTPPALWGNTEGRGHLLHSLNSVPHFTKYADLVVTDSDHNAQQMIDIYGCEAERIRVLPLAVPLQEFKPRAKAEELVSRYGLTGKSILLFVGRQANNKRVDILMRAFAIIHQDHPEVHLLIVGDHNSNSTLLNTHGTLVALASELGVSEAVTFTGRVNTLPDYYNLADVYITASQHEGFGVPLIEAMASGIPVVASNVTTHPWVLGDAGLLVEGEDPAAFAQAIKSVLADPDRKADMVRKGLERVIDFSLDRYFQGWYSIVAELTAWMPASGYMRSRSIPGSAVEGDIKFGSCRETRIGDKLRLASLRDRAYSMQPGPQPSSRIPVVGRFITWIRRNMTSHIKAEYDPGLNAQRAYNREVVEALYDMQSLLETSYDRQSAETASHQARTENLERRLTLMAQEIQLMQMRLTLMQSGTAVDDDVLQDFKRDLNAITQSYNSLRESLKTGEDANKLEA